MEYLKGRGAQINVPNKFIEQRIVADDSDGQDEQLLDHKPKTRVFYDSSKSIISTNASPDLSFTSSINPYQGCEHGCIYCYARSSHEYWGFSSGLDFESKIIVKREAPKLLEQEFLKPSYKPKVIMLSGNTDCYQPLEKKYKLTKQLLEVFEKYKHPVGIITKNALITRDIAILEKLAANNLITVLFSITSLDETLRQRLEPRTATTHKKLQAIELLASKNIPVGIMNAPIIPGLNHHEIPDVLRSAANSGAQYASYTVVRLNGQIPIIFKDWLNKNFPDRVKKVMHLIQSIHDGRVGDSRFGKRMKGDGPVSDMIKQLFEVSHRKYFKLNAFPNLETIHFRKGGNYSLF